MYVYRSHDDTENNGFLGRRALSSQVMCLGLRWTHCRLRSWYWRVVLHSDVGRVARGNFEEISL